MIELRLDDFKQNPLAGRVGTIGRARSNLKLRNTNSRIEFHGVASLLRRVVEHKEPAVTRKAGMKGHTQEPAFVADETTAEIDANRNHSISHIEERLGK